jgi:beta-N-acetylhexosaminidase
MTRCYGTISLWIFGLVLLFVGVNINEPYYLISLRGLGAAALLIASNGVFVLLIKRGYWNGRGAAERLLILLWCLPSLSMLYAPKFRLKSVSEMSYELTSRGRTRWGDISS